MLGCQFEISLKILPMHNFIKPMVTTADALKMVRKKLHSPKKEFFAAHATQLKSLYDEYDQKTAKDELHELEPYWKILPTDDKKDVDSKMEKRHLAYGLYGSDRPFVNAHWEAVTKANGNETLYCPICGLKECEEMDHFVPREEGQYPEYSAHLSNLIPLCHTCNHDKSTKFIDENKKRIFFNAFYDILNRRDIIKGVISISSLDGIPMIKMEVNSSLSPTKKPDMYILSTIIDLELLPLFQDRAKMLFKREIRRLIARADKSWDEIISEYAKEATPHDDDPDIVYPAVMKAIIESQVMETWFKSI